MGRQENSFDALGLNQALSTLPATACYWVGYSGGADSTALLTALSELKVQKDIAIKALHVNHGLHPDSDSWQDHCARYCDGLNIHFESRQVRPKGNSGSGLEAESRFLRYGVVSELLEFQDVFLTAHHFDDQAETLILNLVRGSGIDGLAGMPACRPLGRGFLARPLLDFRMLSLKQYLLDRDIEWIEDPSNHEHKYDRNFLRHELIPGLEKRWPGVCGQLVKSARFCREASTTLGNWAEKILDDHLRQPRILDLCDLPDRAAEFRILVRQWLRINQAPPIPMKRLLELCDQCSNASSESQIGIEWDGWAIRHFQQCLWLQEVHGLYSGIAVPWLTEQALTLPGGGGTLRFTPTAGLPEENLVVRGRRDGDLMQTRAGSGHRRVKDLLRECGIPPWLRSSIPLLIGGDGVLAVGDLLIGPSLEEWQNHHQTQLTWDPDNSLLSFCRDRVIRNVVDHDRALR